MNERPRASTDRNVSRETSGRRDKPSRAREGSSARHGRGEATREAEVDPRTLAGAIELAAQVIDQVVAGHNALEHYHALRAAHPVTEPGAWGRVRDLAWSALRDYGWGRWVLARLAPRGVPEPVLAPLLVALSALRDGPRDAHALTHQSVSCVRLRQERLAGFANALLRTFLREREALHPEALAEAARASASVPASMPEVQDAAVAHFRHPRWWIDKVRAQHPLDWERILHAGNTHPPMGLRLNRRRIDEAEALARFAAAGIAVRQVGPMALLLERPMPVAKAPGIAEGWVSPQDVGAQFAARLLAPLDGERVLDACAAPGGKSAHLLELADIELTAVDVEETRLAPLRRALARLGVAAKVLRGDARHPARWWDGRPFDAILADVPCSGSGVARRHPDIKWLRRTEDVAGFAQQQREILDGLWPLLKPGGRLLYATCSIFAEENEEQVRVFVKRHRDARLVPLDGERETLALLPDETHDGFFYALLRKTA